MVSPGDCLNRAQAHFKVGAINEAIRDEFSAEVASCNFILNESKNKNKYLQDSNILNFGQENIYECPPTEIVNPATTSFMYSDINFRNMSDMYGKCQITIKDCVRKFSPLYNIPSLITYGYSYVLIQPDYSDLVGVRFSINVLFEIVDDGYTYSGDTTILTLGMIDSSDGFPIYLQIFMNEFYDLGYRYLSHNGSEILSELFDFPGYLREMKLIGLNLKIYGYSDKTFRPYENIQVITNDGKIITDLEFPIIRGRVMEDIDQSTPIGIGNIVNPGLRNNSGGIFKRFSILRSASLPVITMNWESLFNLYMTPNL